MIHGMLTLSLLATTAGAVMAAPEPPVPLRFSLVKTASSSTVEGLTFDGGDMFKSVEVNHVAVVVQHPRGTFLFDTGLGRQVDTQFHEEMPLWAKPLLAYGPVRPVRDQLEAAGAKPIEGILLSHAHWDHASALVDFPEAEVWVQREEQEFIQTAEPPVVLPSQVRSPAIKWKRFAFDDRPFAGYDRSLDLFDDGSMVLVPMAGHTPGSVGLFLTVASGRQYFFVGDTVWQREAARRSLPKPWLPRSLVDHDHAGLEAAVQQLHALMVGRPDLVVVPAHDASVHDELGYFPRWVE